MKVEFIETSVLVPYARNTRTHSDEQVKQVAASITEFGFTNPVLIDADNGIIAGHGRVMAAQSLGLEEVPCIRLAHLTEAQKRAYIIADNKLALNAGWDEELLKLELNDLDDLDFDLDLLGFNDAELAAMLHAEEEAQTGKTDPDAVPPVPKDPITKPGNIWLLGNHRLMCGSSTDANTVEALLNGQQPNTLITDQPDANKRESKDDQANWHKVFALFPGAVVYVWHISRFTGVMMEALEQAGFEIKQQIIWNKNAHTKGRSDYQLKHEPCWYAIKKGGDRNWKGGRSQMSVWDIKSVANEDDKTKSSAQKPVEIYTRALEHHTNAGEYVYEPYARFGTSIIACEQLHRRSLSIELDPKYCDVIVQRWQNFTGNSAILESSGQTYAEVSMG
jgi:ParB-like chromosome segregation protein Spo0J